MSYQLLAGEPLSDGIRRIALRRIDKALNQLTNPAFNRDKAVHDARKTCKRLRAILRLIRDEIGYDFYRKENIRFRDASRTLAPARDSAVMVETLDDLVQFFKNTDDPGIQSNGNVTAVPPHLPHDLDICFAQLRANLVERHRTHSREVLETDAVPNYITAVRTARLQVAQWPITREDFSAIAKGLRRVYRRGLLRMGDAQNNTTAESLHEWRKRVKYLWYQLEIIEPIWPTMLAETAESLHTLSSYLGNEHDLAELHQLMQTEPNLLPDSGKQEYLFAMIAHRRQVYQANAWPLGQRLYAEEPETFVQRLGVYWQTWRSEKPINTKQADHQPASKLIPQSQQNGLLTTRQAAESLQKSLNEVRRLIRIGRLPAFKFGCSWMITSENAPQQKMQIVSTRQAAAQLGIPTRQVRTLIRKGQLAASKIGRNWAIDAQALRLMQAN